MTEQSVTVANPDCQMEILRRDIYLQATRDE